MLAISETHAAFWRWFRVNADRIHAALLGEDEYARDEASDELHGRLAEAAPGLTFLIGGKPGDPDREFVLSADGQREYYDAVKELAAAAPVLPGWAIVTFRPRIPLEQIQLRLRGETIDPQDLWFSVEEEREGLALEIHDRYLDDDNREAREMGAVLLLDHTVGERDALSLIASVAVKPWSDSEGDGLRPFNELTEVFDEYRVRRYPPPGEIDLEEEGDWSMLQGQLNELPAFINLNTGIAGIAGHPAYDHLLRVGIFFNDLREDGLPDSGEELSEVQDLGESLADVLGRDQKALLAITVVHDGKRELFFYCSDPVAALEHLARWRKGVTSHRVVSSIDLDSFWNEFEQFISVADEDEDE